MAIEDDLTKWGFSDDHARWIADFRKLNGRAPRVLSIGNIANNAYKNAVILRKRGVECDVLSPNYYHVMGCPEWEEGRFSTSSMDFDRPDWSSVKISGFQRPAWFAQGNLGTCIDYLIALREGDSSASQLWDRLKRETRSPDLMQGSRIFADPEPTDVTEKVALRMSSLFRISFPGRKDELLPDPLLSRYQDVLIDGRRWKRLFSHYDFVIGYSVDGIYPLLFDKRPFICFEHGTIRSIPFDEQVFGQLCALAYSMADDVLITNCDNIIAASRLRLRSYRFVPHAILENGRIENQGSKLRAEILARHGADFIIFHPSRQHWSPERNLNFEKGNDIFIRGFAEFVKTARPKAVLGLVNWGQHVSESKRLLNELGVDDRTFWIDPQPTQIMTDYVAASDVLADQFVIGAWGGIMPIGMMIGVPTLMYLNEQIHSWCFPSMPPILNAKSSYDVVSCLNEATQGEYRRKISTEGPMWYDRFHSETVVAGRLFDSLAAASLSERDCEEKRMLLELRAQLMSFEQRYYGPTSRRRRFALSVIRFLRSVPGLRLVSRRLLRSLPRLRSFIMRRLQLN